MKRLKKVTGIDVLVWIGAGLTMILVVDMLINGQ